MRWVRVPLPTLLKPANFGNAFQPDQNITRLAPLAIQAKKMFSKESVDLSPPIASQSAGDEAEDLARLVGIPVSMQRKAHAVTQSNDPNTIKAFVVAHISKPMSWWEGGDTRDGEGESLAATGLGKSDNLALPMMVANRATSDSLCQLGPIPAHMVGHKNICATTLQKQRERENPNSNGCFAIVLGSSSGRRSETQGCLHKSSAVQWSPRPRT